MVDRKGRRKGPYSARRACIIVNSFIDGRERGKMLCRALTRPRAACVARRLSTAPPGSEGPGKAEPLPPPRPDSTLLFRATNPELQFDPSQRKNWKWPAGVVAFFGAYFVYLYSVGDFLPSEPRSATGPPEGVVKV
jgi:hypothetical protein